MLIVFSGPPWTRAMDNAERSRRTREAVITAAQVILERDGPGRLTLDAIVRESGISKGGLMHQFRSKDAVLKALLENQIESSQRQFEQALGDLDPGTEHKHLIAQLTAMKQAWSTSRGLVSAILAAMAEDPALLQASSSKQNEHVQAMVDEADDADLSILRWTAARGLVVTKMIGMCPFTDAERERLFNRIMDNASWRCEPRSPAIT